MINCLKISEILNDKVVIITSGEDEFIKIWDTKFNLINEFNLRKTGFFEGTATTRNLSAQSIDIFCCKIPKRYGKTDDDSTQQADQNLSVMLIGTRNGDIVEAAFQVEFSGLKMLDKQKDHLQQKESQSDEEQKSSLSSESDGSQSPGLLPQKKQPYTSAETLKFNYSIYLRSHQSQIYDTKQVIELFNKKLFFALHPHLPVMASIGEDQKLILWDTDKNSLLRVHNIGMNPTAIKFSPDGDFLVIAFQISLVLIIDSKMQKNLQAKTQERYSLPSLDMLMSIKDKDTKTPVVNIEFSPKGDMLAISYDNAKTQKDMFDTKQEKETSFIAIYKTSHKSSKSRTTEKTLFTKHIDIHCPSIYEYNETETQGVSAYYMSFSFDSNYLLIYYQMVNNQQTRINNDPQGIYVAWDLNANTSVKNWELLRNQEWKHLNFFPNSLHAEYTFYDNLLTRITSHDQLLFQPQNINQPNETMKVPVMSVMVDINQYLICGSTNGDLHLVKSSCLYYDKDFLTEIARKQMCLAKTYTAHISFVNQIETHQNGEYIYTSGILDETIMKWKLTEEKQLWDIDNLNVPKRVSDPFEELIPKDAFKNLYNEILPLRQGISDKIKNVDDANTPDVELKLKSIIGRKACNCRNNLFYDYDERLIYIAGCNLIITTLDDEDESNTGSSKKQQTMNESETVHQEFIKLDQTSNSCSPEISCIALTNDKKMLAAGTIETKAKILIWDICSRTCIKSLVLNNITNVVNIKFAYDNRHICCNGITSEYSMSIMLIDTEQPSVLGIVNFCYTLPFKVKDLEFYPNSIFRFVTCGFQHMSAWQYCGETLTHRAMEIENPKDLVELTDPKKDDLQSEGKIQFSNLEGNDFDNLKISFLTVIFVQDAIITSGEDGYLYVWDDNRISKKQKAHPNQPILTLHTTKDSSMFVSGGKDGRIILWYLGLSEYSYIVEKIYEYSITSEDVSKMKNNPNNQIQSVCIGSKYILAGTRSGDIYELLRPSEQDLKTLTKINQEKVKLRINCTDHEEPRVVAFSGNGEKLYSITQKGLFSVWDLAKLKRTFMKHFSKETLTMVVCKLSPKIIIAFEQEIIVIDSEKYTLLPNFSLKQKTIISDMKLSFDEKMLAIALARNQEQNAKIEIYDAENEENNFKLLCLMDNLNASIEFLDFSTDNFYLLYKDVQDEISIIDLSLQKKMNILYIEFELEWCSDGIKLPAKAKGGVHSCYTDENRILKITPIGVNNIAVTDEMGTIRIFPYPCPSGSGYVRIYTDHLPNVNQCVTSPNKEILITTSESDRCIMVWKICKVENNKDSPQEKHNIQQFKIG